MTKYAHPDVLDGGLNAIKNNATKMILISAYSNVYATVQSNKLAEVTMTGTDYTLGDGASSARTLTTAASKSAAATASAAGTPNLHVAFTNGSDKVLWVTDETSDQAIVSGNTVNFPQFVYTSNQPT